jgi:arylsulfatase A-like enzyme
MAANASVPHMGTTASARYMPGMRRILTLLLFAAVCNAGAQTTRPNIVFIFSDDHAAHAISAYGSKVNQTPNMDRLAKEGMRFDNCFATNSICTPSRATVLTGKYSHKNGVPVFNRFDGSQPTCQKYLQQAGYYTGMIGKWHLGSDPAGFDYWEIYPGQGLYHDPVLYTVKGQKTYTGQYASDVTTDLTIEFIKNRPKDKPFFVFSGHKAPHRPWDTHPRYAAFKDKVIPEPDNLRDDYAGRTDALRENQQTIAKDLTRRDLKLAPPADLKGPPRNQWLNAKPTGVEVNGKTLMGDDLVKWKYQRYMQDYLACVQSVDDSVGRIIDFIDQNDLRENTIVIYSSDQGFFLGDHGMYDKRFMYEESLRMPFLIRWPAVIKPGGVQKALALNNDFMPTFLDVAGAPPAPGVQGRSLLPLLRGETPADWRHSFYYRYYHDPGHHNTRAHLGVRTDTQKLIHFWGKDQWEFYDLTTDPREMKNLYSDPAHASTVASLKTELQRLKKEVQDNDEFADTQPPAGVDGSVAELRGK